MLTAFPFARVFAKLAFIAVTTIAILTSAAAWSQTVAPTKIVITFPAGSGGDLLTRAMAEQITRSHGLSFTFENANQFVGTEAASRAAPDGKTLLVLNNNFTINSKLQRPPYDPLTNFVPICNLADGPMLIIVDMASPYRTLDDLLTAARRNPGKISVAGGALGPPQIAFEMLKRAAKVDMRFMQVPNTTAAITALSNQSAGAAIQLYLNVQEQLKSNKLRPLAITSPARKQALPNVPTVAEAGLVGYEVEYWDGIYAPAGTPKETVAQLADWFGAAAQTPDAKAVLTAQTYAPVGVCGAEFVTFIHKELEEFGRIVRETNIGAQ
jgi:tripartite-type tricarboxylate transporter receptor subunit TctC